MTINNLLRASAWRDDDGVVWLDLVWEDEAAKSKWSVRIKATPDQAAGLTEKLLSIA